MKQFKGYIQLIYILALIYPVWIFHIIGRHDIIFFPKLFVWIFLLLVGVNSAEEPVCHESFKLESLYGIMTWHFPIRFFLSVALSISKCMSALGPSLSLCKSVFYLIYPFGFFYYVLSVPIFCSKILLILLHPVVGLPSCILPLLAGRIFFRYLGMQCFVFYCLTLSRYF